NVGIAGPDGHYLAGPLSLAAVASRFESLGGGRAVEGGFAAGCEFGFFQRHAGVEPLGLLRWSSIAPTSLAAALESRFDGIDAADNVTVRSASGKDWGFVQTRYGMIVDHTGLALTSV